LLYYLRIQFLHSRSPILLQPENIVYTICFTPSNDGPASNQSSIGMVITKLRDALRIEKLTTLRNDLVDRSYGDRRIVQGKKVRL